MNQSSTPPSTAATPLHRRIHLAGIVVLAVGLLSAMAIYVFATLHDSASNAPDFSADRRFNYEMERVGGKFTVYAAAFNRWLSTLWSGTALAYTVAVLSLLIALLCFWLANFLSYPALEDAPAPKDDSSA
jgi:hypothetical protein